MKTPRIAGIVAITLALGAPNAKATIPVTVVADPYEVIHMISNYTRFLIDYYEQIKQYEELVTNNEYTETIKNMAGSTDGLQEFAESWAENTLISEVRGMAGGVMGLLDSDTWTGELMNTFDGTMDIFQQMSLSQSGSQTADMTQYNRQGGGQGASNRISGMRSALSTRYLQGSREREEQLNNWQVTDYGKNDAEIQATQTELLKEQVKGQHQAAQMAALDRLQDTADRAAIEEQYRAKSARAYTQNKNFYQTQLTY